jgi:hypothetical protein
MKFGCVDESKKLLLNSEIATRHFLNWLWGKSIKRIERDDQVW